MKTPLVPLILFSIAMICSCQKQDALTEQQLAQRKAEMEAREKALGERVNALDEKVNVLEGKVRALSEKENTTWNTRMTPTGVQGQAPDAAQVQAERDRMIQQFSADIRARLPEPEQLKAARAAKDRLIQERLAEKQRSQGQLPGQDQRKVKIPGPAVFPVPQAAAPTVEATSPTLSPSIEAASPTPSTTPQ